MWVWLGNKGFAFPVEIGGESGEYEACADEGIPEVADNGVDYQKTREENEDHRYHGIAPGAVGAFEIRLFVAKNDHPGAGHGVEYPRGENDVGDKLVESTREN